MNYEKLPLHIISLTLCLFLLAACSTSQPTATLVPATATLTPVPPTATPTDTLTPIPPTATPMDTPVPTDTPTNTPVPTDTPTNTPSPTPSNTPTYTPTNTPLPTDTPVPTDTPTVLPTEPSIPETMLLYTHWDDNPPKHFFLSASRESGTHNNIGFSIIQEWGMVLEKDLVGTQYAYAIYASQLPERPAAVCDVEILLRRGSNDTVLVSWPQAFTADSTNDMPATLYTGQTTGIDPDVQTGDMLVLRIRAVNGTVVVWMREVEGWSAGTVGGGYSYIQVPGYSQ